MSKLPTPNITNYGDHAVLVRYPADGFSHAISDAVHALAARLRAQGIWREVVPAYDSVTAVFDSAALSMTEAQKHVTEQMKAARAAEDSAGKLIDIPVYYGGDNGPDMATICKSSGLSEADVIKTHSAQSYRVCMMGFIPGFTFLSEAPKILHHPRLATPRAKVPAGSVGIANWQTGIYGLESPGGWQIIGRTPLSIFDKTRPAPFLIEAGDRVRFVPTQQGAS